MDKETLKNAIIAELIITLAKRPGSASQAVPGTLPPLISSIVEQFHRDNIDDDLLAAAKKDVIAMFQSDRYLP